MFNLFKKKNDKNRVKYSHADYNIIFENQIVEGFEIKSYNIGSVNFPTGKVIVCDPLAFPDTTPYKRKIPKGKYPVVIYSAKNTELGERHVIVKLQLNSNKAEKWEMALREGEKAKELKEEGDFFGFPVDAGVAGIYDYQTALEYEIFDQSFTQKNPEKNLYDDYFADEFKKNARNLDDCGHWINHKLPNSNSTISMFTSGYGDGLYPAYWGIDKNGKLTSLVIDFFILLLPDEE